MPHEVTIAGSGETFFVGDGDSVLAAALAANIHLSHDCKSGTCATCRVRLVAGAVAYREEPMGLLPEEAEAGYALACQARPGHGPRDRGRGPARRSSSRRRATGRSSSRSSRSRADVTRLVLELPGRSRPSPTCPASTSASSSRTAGRAASRWRRPRAATASTCTSAALPAAPSPSAARRRSGRARRSTSNFPLGAFFLRKADFRPLLMVATGTGLAPLKCILESLMDDPDCPPSLLYWGIAASARASISTTTSPDGAERLPEFDYRPVLSRAASRLGRPPRLRPGRRRRRYRRSVGLCDLSLRLPDHGCRGQGAVHRAGRQPQPHLLRQLPVPAQPLIRASQRLFRRRCGPGESACYCPGGGNRSGRSATPGPIAVVFSIRYAVWTRQSAFALAVGAAVGNIR